MNIFKKTISVILSLLIVASGSSVAYAEGNGAERIQFNTLTQEEIQMNALEEKGDGKITLFENAVTEFNDEKKSFANRLLMHKNSRRSHTAFGCRNSCGNAYQETKKIGYNKDIN